MSTTDCKKCDEGQPECLKCLKSHRTCQGMKQASSVIHFENSFASGLKKRPRGPRPISLGKQREVLGIELRSLTIDLNTQAIAYYCRHHLQALKNVQDGMKFSTGVSDFFLPVWKLKADCPILDLGVSSLALALFARIKQHPPAAIEASAKYSWLLNVMRDAMLSLSTDNIDVCLLAIFFMSRYEDVLHLPSQVNPVTPTVACSKSFSHHDGALAVLKFWKDNLRHSLPATNVIKHTRRGVMRSALLRGHNLPSWICNGSSFGERGVELAYDHIFVRIVKARFQMFQHLDTSKCEFELALDELKEELRKLDIEIREWTLSFPSAWLCKTHTIPVSVEVREGDPAGTEAYTYSNTSYAAVWNLYHSTRMLINSTRLRILDMLYLDSEDNHVQERIECISNMKLMGKDFAASVPISIRNFKTSTQLLTVSSRIEETLPYMALMTIWPLSIISSLGNLDIEQRAWFRVELARLGRLIGYGLFESAASDFWLEL